MERLRESKAASMRVVAEEIEYFALRARALTTVLKERVQDEVQDGLVSILDDLVTDVEELLPATRALARPPSPAAEPPA